MNDLILLSDYKKNVVCVRNSFKLNLKDFFQYKKKIADNREISELLILPSTEYLNRFLLSNRAELESNGFIIPLCSLKLYEQLSDKYNFTKLCVSNNILVPAEYESLDTVEIPFVAKPKKYFSDNKEVNKKPAIITSNVEYVNLRNSNHEDFYFQEFIGGQSYYLLFYFSKDGQYSIYSQENLVQQHNGLSIIAAKSSNIHQNFIASQYAALLFKTGFTGLIMIEIKHFKDKFYMIEANPRLWGPSQLILDAGMDLFDRFAYDNGLGNKLPEKNYITGKRYFWSGGIIEDQKQNCEIKFHNYNKNLFFDEYCEWCKADIYIRKDTESTWFKELYKS